LDNPKTADLDGGPSHLIVIDIECLCMLNKLPDAVESLKSELLSELQNILIRCRCFKAFLRRRRCCAAA